MLSVSRIQQFRIKVDFEMEIWNAFFFLFGVVEPFYEGSYMVIFFLSYRLKFLVQLIL